MLFFTISSVYIIYDHTYDAYVTHNTLNVYNDKEKECEKSEKKNREGNMIKSTFL